MKYFLKKIILLMLFINFSIYSQEILTIPENEFKVPDNRDFDLNHSVSPCENFFNYVCSNEIANFRIPETHNKYVFSFIDSYERIKNKRSDYIKSLLQQSGDLSKRNKMIKNFYNSCINDQKILKEEESILRENINLIYSLNKEEILKLFSREAIIGQDYLISINEVINNDNNNLKDILFSYTLPFEAKDYYKDKDLLEDYKKNLIMFFNTFGINNSETNSNFIINFETSMAEVYPKNEDYNEIVSGNNEVDRNYLINNFKNIYFKIILNNIPKNIKINLITKEIFSKIDELFGLASLEELRALALWYKTNTEYIKYSQPLLYDEFKKFNNKYFGLSLIDSEKNIDCMLKTESYLERSLDFEIVNKYYLDFSSNRIKNIVTLVHEAAAEKIKNNNWLSKNAQAIAISKIKNMKFKLVKPNKISEWGLEPFVNFSEDKYINNIKLLNKKNFKKMLRNINNKNSSDKWLISPLSANAYYDFLRNQFVLPLGILQPPFYDEAASDIVNLGAIGMIISHEIGHAIDDLGAKYNENGKLSPWMTEQDIKIFKDKTKKLVTFFEKNGVNGNLTLSENIADYFGINNAFQAAFPKNKIFDNQLKRDFFIQFGRVFCGVYQKKYQEYLLKTDPHSPVEVRINNQARLSKNFEEAFFCKKDDPMTLDDNERISLW